MRLFIALKLSEEQQHEVGVMQSRLKKYLKGVKWVRPGNMHLTLRFLGETDSKAVTLIMEALDKASTSLDPFQFAFGGTGVFPHPGKPRVLWIGMQKGQQEVVKVSEIVGLHLSEMGFAKENREFHPHLTLGRLRGPIKKEMLKLYLEDEQSFTTTLSEVTDIILYQSILDRNGARYIEIFKSKLK